MDGRRDDGPGRSGVSFGGSVSRVRPAHTDDGPARTDAAPAPVVELREGQATFAVERLGSRSRGGAFPAIAVAAVLVGIAGLGLLGRAPAQPLPSGAAEARPAPDPTPTPDPDARPVRELLVLTSPSHEGAFAGSTELTVVGYVRGGERLVTILIHDDVEPFVESTVRAVAKPGDPAASLRSWFGQSFPLADLPAGGPLWVDVSLLGDDGRPLELVRRGVSREVARAELEVREDVEVREVDVLEVDAG